MLKINDRIVWKFKGDKIYVEGYVKEIKGKITLIADSSFGLRQWVNSEEIEVGIVERNDQKNKMPTKTTKFACNHCGILKSFFFHWTKNICKACSCLYTPCGKCGKLIFWKLVHISNNKNETDRYRCLNCLKKEYEKDKKRNENKKRKT